MASCKELVLVTGCSGFVGLHVCSALRAAGYSVRATTRNVEKHASAVEAVAPGTSLVQIDLVGATAAEWEAAAAGCALCCHVASPFPVAAPKDESELIVPAVEGTHKVLAACKAVGVRRVVVTSSVAAVSSGLEGDEFSAADWSDVSKCGPYPKSKTLAEKAARDYSEESAQPAP